MPAPRKTELHKLIYSKYLTLTEFADKIGIHLVPLGRMLNGKLKTGKPYPKTLAKMAKALDTPVEKIVYLLQDVYINKAHIWEKEREAKRRKKQQQKIKKKTNLFKL